MKTPWTVKLVLFVLITGASIAAFNAIKVTPPAPKLEQGL